MRGLLILIPAVMLAQTTPAPKAATTPATPTKAATTAAPGRGAAGRGAPGRGATTAKPPAPKPLTTDDEKTVYALGLSIAKSLSPFDLSPAEIDILKRALTDAAANKPEVKLDDWGPKIDPLARARCARVAEKEKVASMAYLAKAAAEPGAVKTESGLIFKELRAGTGASPKATDTVKVNYRGTLVDGTEFDSSYKRNEPAQFPAERCDSVLDGRRAEDEGRRQGNAVCPSNLAYGDQGRPVDPGRRDADLRNRAVGNRRRPSSVGDFPLLHRDRHAGLADSHCPRGFLGRQRQPRRLSESGH